mgnify:FL=1
MPKKIKLYDKGDCVEVSTWDSCCEDGFFKPGRAIGLVLEAEYVEMDDPDGFKDGHEWMYRVVLPDGRVTEVWDYEVRPVNTLPTEYNKLSHKANKENKWQRTN